MLASSSNFISSPLISYHIILFYLISVCTHRRVSSIETGCGDDTATSSLNRVMITDKITKEQVLIESDHIIVATDPETARSLLLEGE